MKKKNISSPAPFTSYAAPRGRVYNSFLETVGGTPLVALPRLSEYFKLHGSLLIKLEFFNPLGSVKDRIGVAMLRDAETKGLITPGKTVLIEPTSGNTGISLALAAVALGYQLIVTMPENASSERRKMLLLMGAKVELTPASQGMAGAINKSEELLRTLPDAWMPSQFENEANPAIHEQTTAREIWEDTEGKVDMVVAGLGTGGTASGIAHGLKKHRKDIQVFGVEPHESAVLHGDEPGPHGIQGIGPGFEPDTLDIKALTDIFEVSEKESLQTARLCASIEGIPIGISSGAALFAGINLAKKTANKGKTIVVIAPSFAERYLSTALFDGLG
ncbi:cysteine synthase A [Swingsia samuiensis]|uniref:Cysteine synthase n=1 Tax=Swingsia samuiensis TaxID=1293412 RepID=A0A4Y6UKY3_9PROT|nr:cysteine synthase A [Swingsia samuiensis]QDH16695.1 cysteine synthase A [Swingsia samuiensis]